MITFLMRTHHLLVAIGLRRFQRGTITYLATALIMSMFASPAAHAACEPGQNQVSFYTDANFGGSCVVKSLGDYPNSGVIGLANDSISSLRVGIGAQVVVCKDNDFQGDCILLTTDVSFLNDNQVGNDAVSSAKVQALGTNQCVPAANQVSFFTNANFLGNCVVKNLGEYPNSGAIGLPNDSISSIRVGRSAQAVICKDNNFGGDCILIAQDVSFLNNNQVGNDQVSSAKVQQRGATACPPGNFQVSFFTDADFLGSCVVKGVGVYASADAIGLPNDTISSVRIGPNAQAVICKDNDFKDDCILLTSDVRILTGDRVGNDAVSSGKVQTLGTAECEPGPNQAAFFMHAGFLAPCVVKGIGTYAGASQIGLDNQSISSIKIGLGAMACTYDQDNFAGPAQTYTSGSSFLGSNNDLISSLRVQAAGTTCAEILTPFISVGIELFDVGNGFRLLHIRGNGFQAAEFVRLQITSKQGTDNPITVNQQTTADAAGNVDFKYTGAGGGVCNTDGEIVSFQVQGSGLTSGKVSNVAQAGCP